MKILRKIALFLCVGLFLKTDAQQIGDKCPDFSMYQYKDQSFDSKDVFGKKTVAFVFGSIT